MNCGHLPNVVALPKRFYDHIHPRSQNRIFYVKNEHIQHTMLGWLS